MDDLSLDILISFEIKHLQLVFPYAQIFSQACLDSFKAYNNFICWSKYDTMGWKEKILFLEFIYFWSYFTPARVISQKYFLWNILIKRNTLINSLFSDMPLSVGFLQPPCCFHQKLFLYPHVKFFQHKCTAAMKDNWIKNDLSTNENDVWKI